MKNDNNIIKDKVYDLEIYFEPIYLISEIIKDFGEYCTGVSDGTEKMRILLEILREKSLEYKKFLVEFIPEIIKSLDEI